MTKEEKRFELIKAIAPALISTTLNGSESMIAMTQTALQTGLPFETALAQTILGFADAILEEVEKEPAATHPHVTYVDSDGAAYGAEPDKDWPWPAKKEGQQA